MSTPIDKNRAYDARRRSLASFPFRLLSGTGSVSVADSLVEARADAKHFIRAGAFVIQIQKRLPSGDFHTVAIIERKVRKR